MQWHYQTIMADDPSDGCTLVEVYVNEDGFVIGWCERDAPVGNDQADLVGELERMLADAKRYPLTTKDELRKLIPEQTNEHTQGT